jgi:hypothetical protein
MLELALRAFLTLLVVVDPVGIAPVYLGLVAARPRAEQASLTILVGHAGPDPLDREYRTTRRHTAVESPLAERDPAGRGARHCDAHHGTRATGGPSCL